jgi:hypothetical protein
VRTPASYTIPPGAQKLKIKLRATLAACFFIIVETEYGCTPFLRSRARTESQQIEFSAKRRLDKAAVAEYSSGLELTRALRHGVQLCTRMRQSNANDAQAATREATRVTHPHILAPLLEAQQRQPIDQVEVDHRCRPGETLTGDVREHRVATTQVKAES